MTTTAITTPTSSHIRKTDAMNETTPHPMPGSPAFNLDAMRLPANYGDTLGVKKVLTTVQVGKPDKSRFFRARSGEESTLRAFIVQLKDVNETYLVFPHIAPILGGLARPAQLHAAIDRHNNLFLIPVFLPGEDGKRNPWHESLAQAVHLSEDHWVRVVANMAVGGYDVLQAQGALAEPVWPDTTMEEMIAVAFRGKVIDSEDHAVIRALLGAV